MVEKNYDKIITNKDHLNNLKEIVNFLIESNIPFDIDENNQRIFYLNEGKIELRYVDSENHKMGVKKFGIVPMVPNDYFINITLKNRENGITTIWIKDFEASEEKTIIDVDGNKIKNYKRKWSCIKSHIKTITGTIEHRFYARDCIVKEVPNNELRPFLETNCFYGYRSATKNLGLYLKKDKNGHKKGELLIVYTFGHAFYGKGKYSCEIIRVSTKLYCQVIGGASKLLKYFLVNYPTLIMGGKERKMEKIVFIVDADHNSGNSLQTLGFDFISHKGHGFINIYTESGITFQRKPLKHKEVMEQIKNGEVYSVANAGSIIYTLDREEYIKKQNIDVEKSKIKYKKTAFDTVFK